MLSLQSENGTIPFLPVALQFAEHRIINIFALKNNRTLGETILHPRYRSLKSTVDAHYSDYFNMPLGRFLLERKNQGDPFYRSFLNSYGDATFCTFRIDDAQVLSQKGLYAYVTGNIVRYLGRCRDAFGKRVNQGYGMIHPKNCYRDGQATNCHLNALIAEQQAHISFHVFPMIDSDEIIRLERALIQAHLPDWNIALKPVQMSKHSAS